MNDQEVFARVMRKARKDPSFYCTHILGQEPWGIQTEILNSVRDNPRTAVPSCHASGKSWTAARAALWFLHTHRHSIVFTTAPTFKQVKNIIWKDIGSALRSCRIPMPGRLYKDARLEIESDWFAFGLSTDDPNSFQGLHAEYILGIFDEASGVASEIWEALEGNLSAGKIARFLSIGNPTDPTGDFFRECSGPRANVIPISVFDTPNYTHFGITLDDILNGTWQAKITDNLPFPSLAAPQYAADMLQTYGAESPQFQSRVLGQFPQQGTDSLIWLSWAHEAARKSELEQIPAIKQIDMGVDVARFGDDESVIAVVAHGYQLEQRVSAKDDTVETTGKVWRCILDYHERYPEATIAVRVDEPGVGGSVIDQLKAMTRRARGGEEPYPWLRIYGAQTGNGARDKQSFVLRRDEWWWAVRQWFEDKDITIVPDPLLIEQLTGIKYDYSPRGQIRIEQKSEAKKRGIGSPDRADALMLAIAPVKRTAGAKILTLSTPTPSRRTGTQYMKAL